MIKKHKCIELRLNIFFSHKTFILLSDTKKSTCMPTGITLNRKIYDDLIAQILVTGFLLKKPNFMNIFFNLSFNIEPDMCLSDLSGPGRVIERTFGQ